MKKIIFKACGTSHAARLTAFIVLALVIAVYLFCLANEERPSQKLEENDSSFVASEKKEEPTEVNHSAPSDTWKEYKGLVKIWPQLKNENIETIIFTDATSRNEAYFKKPFNSSGFRLVDANIVEEWPYGCEIPKENLPEFVETIDKSVKNAQKRAGGCSTDTKRGSRMMIVTDKGKYIFCINGDIPIEVADIPLICGDDWASNKLGTLYMKYCCSDIEYKYDFPPKEQVVAVLLYLSKYSPPLAIFGNKKLAEKFIFENYAIEPNGVYDPKYLYKSTRLREFGVKAREEGRKYIFDKELKPKRILEGREWLEKIMDTYEIALKEAQEKDKYYPGMTDPFNARILFMTEDGDCWKRLGIDANSVFDDYIKSEKLKKYFDELDLTEELLAEELNKEN